ncbi:MAG: hypothetical protein GX774_17650 [Armatimonadetes bacterium]|jgi:CRISPR/Cas system CSM-associated protein Csm3 (group 7 of RAMP superfamily)|nr:hypothetical protein [Armatimonadota bacterium]
MNVYNFVPIDKDHPPQRAAIPRHDRYEGLAGQIQCQLKAERPLFLPGIDGYGRPLVGRGELRLFSRSEARRSKDNPDGLFIAGSSLKGLLRSIVEATAPGCFQHLQHNRERGGTVPEAFHACPPRGRDPVACPACRLFGFIGQGTDAPLRRGCVECQDAVCVECTGYEAIYTAILGNPKQRHSAFYAPDGRLAGRKFYYHHREDQLLTESGWRISNRGERQNAHIEPVRAGTRFAFTVDFANVSEEDLEALLFALVLEENLRHKFGYAKPCGLGSVQITVERLVVLRNPVRRYVGSGAEEEWAGAAAAEEARRRAAAFQERILPCVLEKLQEIWRWPPAAGVDYRYPSQAWFAENPRAPLSATP